MRLEIGLFFVLYLILVVIFRTSVMTSEDGVAIVGGEIAKPHEFPYLVEIRRFDLFWMRSVHACSGVIIHSQWILTAAHCIIDYFYMYLVVAGKHDNSPFVRESNVHRVRIIGIYVPDSYERMVLKDDIALLRLIRAIPLNESVKAIPLPKPGFSAKGMATVAGWGTYIPPRNTSNFLMKLVLPLVSKKECLDMYGPKEKIFNTSLCAGYIEGGKDACDGNSGGGLFCHDQEQNTVLCGILSRGKGCALPKAPAIFTNVSCFVDWINDTITKYT